MSIDFDALETDVCAALDELLARNYGDTLNFTFGRFVRASSVEFDAPPNRVSIALRRLADDDECPIDVRCVKTGGRNGGTSSWAARRRELEGER